MDRLRRTLPLPLLLLATAGALLSPPAGMARPGWPGLLVAVAAGVWTVLVGPRRRVLACFGIIAFSAVLVGVSPWYGVFAYSGFLFAYPLPGRWWRTVAFALNALATSASMSGGYPWQPNGSWLTYLFVGAVMMALVMNSATITNRAIEQNNERGRMLHELAELQEELLVREREAGVVQERQRLAGEIHDTLAQGLTGIIAQLNAAKHVRDDPDQPDWAQLDRHIELAATLARDSLKEARRSVQALRPEQLEGSSLPEALGELAGEWSRRTGIPADIHTSGPPTGAGPDTEAALYRVAQEALTNVGKHAGASRVRLTLTYLDDTLLLDVADDGHGFDPAASTDGYGLVGMRHRLAGVNGTLTVESASGYGTTLNAAVPIGAPR